MPIPTAPVHHLRLTVIDVARSQAFYTEVVDFEQVMDLPSGVFLSNGAVDLGIGPSPDPARAPSVDRFDEARIGLDHLSFSVGSRAELERAERLLDERGTPHGEITDLGAAFGIFILALRDPDNIQIELTAPGARTPSGAWVTLLHQRCGTGSVPVSCLSVQIPRFWQDIGIAQ